MTRIQAKNVKFALQATARINRDANLTIFSLELSMGCFIVSYFLLLLFFLVLVCLVLCSLSRPRRVGFRFVLPAGSLFFA